MSVIMTLRVRGDAAKLERYAATNAGVLQAISKQAQDAGVIAHRFYASDDGEIMVIDEWPDPESFQQFFAAAAGQIDPIMREAGVTAEPEVRFWRKLETGDDVGWGA